MNRVLWISVMGLSTLLIAAAETRAQRTAYIGYAYPAGGRQGTTFEIRLGGQRLTGARDVIVSGTGVRAKVIDYIRRIGNQEMNLMKQQLRELKREAAQRAKAKKKPDPTAQKIIARIEKRIAEWVNRPACASHVELVFVRVTIAPDAEPGKREIRVVAARGVSNPLPFYVGQVPEVARKPMKTCVAQVLGKEYLALRKRPEEEVEVRIDVPCTMNGQIASGEVNRYRFKARKGQRLVISTAARRLVPYIADAVPGWFQPILTLYDADGKELAFADDYRFHPDPVLFFEVPRDGQYVLEITDALYRGREDFIYRITIGELPFVTTIFPLGGRVGHPVAIERDGWNLDHVRLAPPPETAGPGVYRIAAKVNGFVSNTLPFALDTLPESFDREPNGDEAHAQKVALPVIVNGRIDHPDDWDVFRVEGRAGQTLVAEVTARRLDSPMDSLIKITDARGRVLAFNDDHEDLGSGLNTHHADSYVRVELPADGMYYVHVGDTTRSGGEACAYRLRISEPRPDFELRVVPSRLAMRSRGSAAVSVYAFRKDGFDGPIRLRVKESSRGFSSRPVTLPPGKSTARLPVRTDLKATERPVRLAIEGVATIQGREVVHEAVPAEDWMQAFLWRHLVPVEELVALVYDPSREPPTKRVPPSPPAGSGAGEFMAKPKAGKLKAKPPGGKPKAQPGKRTPRPKPKFTKRQVAARLRQLKMLYEEWLLTDDFYLRKVAECETFQ